MDNLIGSVRKARGQEERLRQDDPGDARGDDDHPLRGRSLPGANRAALKNVGAVAKRIGHTALSWPLAESPKIAPAHAVDAGGDTINLRPGQHSQESGEMRSTLMSAAWVEFDNQKQMLMSAVDITDVHARRSCCGAQRSAREDLPGEPRRDRHQPLERRPLSRSDQRWVELFGYGRGGCWAHFAPLESGPTRRSGPVSSSRVVRTARLQGFETRFRKKSAAIIDAVCPPT